MNFITNPASCLYLNVDIRQRFDASELFLKMYAYFAFA